MSNQIFKHNGNSFTSGHFGWQGDDKMLLLYGLKEGYKNGADELVNFVMKDGTPQVLDTFLFPIVFLYRHYIEIEIKKLYYRVYSKFPKNSHNLFNLYFALKEDVFEKLTVFKEFINNNSVLNVIEKIIFEFHNKDEGGDVFRYLTDKNYKPYFENFEYVDYEKLKKSVNEIYEFFDHASFIPIEDLNEENPN